MEEFDPTLAGPWRPDILSEEEFVSRYEAVRCLITEANEKDNELLLDIMIEEKDRIELENPNATFRMKRAAGEPAKYR